MSQFALMSTDEPDPGNTDACEQFLMSGIAHVITYIRLLTQALEELVPRCHIVFCFFFSFLDTYGNMLK